MSAELVAELERQEADLVFERFDEADAWWLGSLLVSLGAGKPLAIDIRRGDQQLFHAALPGAVADNDRWIERKVRIVERFGVSSYLMGRRLAATGKDLHEGMGLDPAKYAAHGGAFPIAVRNTGIVAVVTVSGLPQAEDHALVVSALQRFR